MKRKKPAKFQTIAIRLQTFLTLVTLLYTLSFFMNPLSSGLSNVQLNGGIARMAGLRDALSGKVTNIRHFNKRLKEALQ
ncbi:hypothetical protein IQ250_26450 [Pseudanabaenaceae cyanobacterium LEGE 13415]|nr:hypothetical protein [Pseudanabaenaceae cyanobacterium LEGE 13415]